MSEPREVSPAPISVDLTEEGIGVEYLDGRSVFYHGVPQKSTSPHATTPGTNVHVLVTDAEGTEGVLVYLNDRKTDGDILEDSGVGRLLLAKGKTTSVYPGVTVSREGFSFELELEADVVDGRVFVFEETDMSERRFELVDE